MDVSKRRLHGAPAAILIAFALTAAAAAQTATPTATNL
jgi:hypothetical protein